MKFNIEEIKLSVVIQNYNYGHFISDALDSLLHQTFRDFEVIIIDDGSTDNSLEVISAYSSKFKNFKVITYETNKGTHYSINHSIDLAQGEYIHWLAADDFRAPNFFEECMSQLLSNPSIGICCSDFGYTDEKSGRFNFLSTRLLANVYENLVLEPKSLISLMRHTDFWIPGHTTIIKKSSILKYGPFKSELLEKCDWYLFHLIALKEGVIYLPKTLSYLYCHTKSYSANITSSKKLKRQSAEAVVNLLKKDNDIYADFIKSTLLKEIILQDFHVLLKSPRAWQIFYYCLNLHYLKKFFKRRHFG